MSDLAFLVEPSVHDGNSGQRFYYAAQELGHRIVLDEPDSPNTIFYGSINQARKYPEFVWCNWDALRCQGYYPKYGDLLLQQEYGFYPFSEVKRLKDFLFKTFGQDGRIFVRPDENDKSFVGSLINDFEFNSIPLKMNPWIDGGLVVVARPTKILKEWRLIVAHGSVVTGSLYRMIGLNLSTDREFPDEVGRFAEEVFKAYTPHPILVIDVGLTEQGLRVIEIGSVNVAGFYDCDIKRIVRAMAEVYHRNRTST